MREAEWDAEAIYDAEFSPLVAQLIALAKKHDMPLHVTVQYAGQGEDSADYCSTHIEGSRATKRFGDIYRAAYRPHEPLIAITVTSTKAAP